MIIFGSLVTCFDIFKILIVKWFLKPNPALKHDFEKKTYNKSWKNKFRYLLSNPFLKELSIIWMGPEKCPKKCLVLFDWPLITL